MGKGNVGVTGAYEGLFYIDNDDFHVYRRNDVRLSGVKNSTCVSVQSSYDRSVA